MHRFAVLPWVTKAGSLPSPAVLGIAGGWGRAVVLLARARVKVRSGGSVLWLLRGFRFCVLAVAGGARVHGGGAPPVVTVLAWTVRGRV